jgi:hypothetical protein
MGRHNDKMPSSKPDVEGVEHRLARGGALLEGERGLVPVEDRPDQVERDGLGSRRMIVSEIEVPIILVSSMITDEYQQD